MNTDLIAAPPGQRKMKMEERNEYPRISEIESIKLMLAKWMPFHVTDPSQRRSLEAKLADLQRKTGRK